MVYQVCGVCGVGLMVYEKVRPDLNIEICHLGDGFRHRKGAVRYGLPHSQFACAVIPAVTVIFSKIYADFALSFICVHDIIKALEMVGRFARKRPRRYKRRGVMCYDERGIIRVADCRRKSRVDDLLRKTLDEKGSRVVPATRGLLYWG